MHAINATGVRGEVADPGKALDRPGFQEDRRRQYLADAGNAGQICELRSRPDAFLQTLRESLLAAGVPAHSLFLGSDDPAPTRHSAGLRWIEGDTP